MSALWTGLSSEDFPWLATAASEPALTAGSRSEMWLCTPLARSDWWGQSQQCRSWLLYLSASERGSPLPGSHWLPSAFFSFSLGWDFFLGFREQGEGALLSPFQTLPKALCCTAKESEWVHVIKFQLTMHFTAGCTCTFRRQKQHSRIGRTINC